MSPTWTPSSIFKPCLSNAFLASLAICSSTAPKNVGKPSKTVTSAPKRRQTEPISRPITPEPIRPNRLGTEPIRNAPSLDKICSSSNGAAANERALEPVATTTCLAVICSELAPLTWIQKPSGPVDTKDPRPCKKVTLFFLNRYKMPSLFCLITASLRPIMRSTSSEMPLISIPWSAKWWLACSKCSEDCNKALEGMQPTLVQVPPGAGPPAAFFHSSIQATFMPNCAARMAAM